ncbi:MAG: hypothetical protein OXF88_15920 [Rhodobacteraceae bacterium]|nr:hypothetical protein [Paracoccaceae bacterium]
MGLPAAQTTDLDRTEEKRRAREYMRDYRARKKREAAAAKIPKPVENAQKSLVDQEGPAVLIRWIESNLRVPSGPLAGRMDFGGTLARNPGSWPFIRAPIIVLTWPCKRRWEQTAIDALLNA